MWAKTMDVQMKAAVFKPSDPSYVLIFLELLKTACDSNRNEECLLSSFPYLVQETANEAWSYQVTADERNSQPEGRLTTYGEATNYLLETYAADNVTDEAEAEITSLKQPADMTSAGYYAVFWKQAPRWAMICNESQLTGIFIEGLFFCSLFSTCVLGSTQGNYLA